jgi:hypothetical protein
MCFLDLGIIETEEKPCWKKEVLDRSVKCIIVTLNFVKVFFATQFPLVHFWKVGCRYRKSLASDCFEYEAEQRNLTVTVFEKEIVLK